MISQELFDELQAQHKANNKRVEVYGVHQSGEMEFLHSHLGTPAAFKYSEAHAKLHPDRFEEYIIGNIQQVEDGDYSTYKHVAKTS